MTDQDIARVLRDALDIYLIVNKKRLQAAADEGDGRFDPNPPQDPAETTEPEPTQAELKIEPTQAEPEPTQAEPEPTQAEAEPTQAEPAETTEPKITHAKLSEMVRAKLESGKGQATADLFKAHGYKAARFVPEEKREEFYALLEAL